jgi:hypothetical protein
MVSGNFCQISLQYPNLGARSRAALERRAVSNSTNTALRQEQPTFAASLYSAESSHLQRTPIPCADTYTQEHPFTLSTPTPLPNNCCAGPGHLYCVVQQRPRLAEQERDTFYTTKGQLSNRATLRPTWTRNTRMLAASHRLTRLRCSRKVLQPITSGASEVNWRYGS